MCVINLTGSDGATSFHLIINTLFDVLLHNWFNGKLIFKNRTIDRKAPEINQTGFICDVFCRVVVGNAADNMSQTHSI